MKKIRLKKFKRNEKGISVIALIVAILLLGSIGYIMSSLISRSQESIPRTMDSTRAFYSNQAGVEYAGKYLKGVSDWSTLSGSLTRTLATGTTFTVQWGAYDSGTKTITATITGTSGSSQRQVSVVFKNAGTSYAVTTPGGIKYDHGGYVDCDPADPANTLCTGGACDCIQTSVNPSTIPTVWFSGATPPTLPFDCDTPTPGNYFIPAGVYYCSGNFKIDNYTNITLGGPVTIFVNKEIRVDHGSNVNGSGSAANLLVISGNDNTDIHHASIFKGAIYSEQEGVKVREGAVYTGIIVGGETGKSDTITLDDGYVNFDPQAGSNCSYYSSLGLPGGGRTILTSWQE